MSGRIQPKKAQEPQKEEDPVSMRHHQLADGTGRGK